MFDGWLAARNIDLTRLTSPRFLNLVHHYILLVTDPSEHKKLNQELIGPSQIERKIDERAGFVPPSWWKGDKYASDSMNAARFTLTKTR